MNDPLAGIQIRSSSHLFLNFFLAGKVNGTVQEDESGVGFT
jgi:hypothetical protein